MTLTQINSLLAVLDYGGFTEASKRLFMTQSAVSQAIAALEQELGVNILLRDRRKAIQLTTAGHRIVQHLRAINREVNAVKEIAEQEKQNPQRTLRLGCFPSVCACILPVVIRYFEIHHPNIKIIPFEENREGANKRGNSSRLTQSFHFFMFEPIFSPVNALNQP
ncbi:LysR family transcriptional regulator, partial [Escherichia coli]